jgi:hypothetical protein
MISAALSLVAAPAVASRQKPKTDKQQTQRATQTSRQLAKDLKLLGVDLLVLNPGDSRYAANQRISTDSRVRLFVRYKNAGVLPINLKGISWGVVEGPLLESRIFSQEKTLKTGDEDSDVLNYFGPGKLEPKKYTIKVELDSPNKSGDTDRSNNSLVRQFEVHPSSLYSGLPDMRIREVRAGALSSCGRTRNYQIAATAVNAGTAPADIHGNNIINVDPPLKTDYNAGFNVTVPPKSAVTVKYEAALEAGSTHRYTFTTDKWGQLKESDETNNSYLLTLQVPPSAAGEKCDFVISEAYLEFTPNNQLYWLVVKIKNLGSNPVTLCQDMVIWETVEHPPGFGWIGTIPSYPLTLKPGDVFEPSTSAFKQMPKGTYAFKIKVDPRNLFEETNKNNNTYTLTARVPEDLHQR